MHAYLFVGGSPGFRKKKVYDFADKKELKTFEFALTKIEDVRILANFTKFAVNTPTAILINSIENATTEALNAFLKSLEEPSKNITYILDARSEQSVLPTIVSRCQLIRVYEDDLSVNNQVALDFLKAGVGEKMKRFDVLRKRQEALSFIEDLVLSAHQEMISAKADLTEMVHLIKVCQNTIVNLNLNGNIGLNLTNLAVKTSLNSV